MYFPLVPHLLHVQNWSARILGPDEDPEGSIREKVGLCVVVQRASGELRKDLGKIQINFHTDYYDNVGTLALGPIEIMLNPS